jgi:hypothetical protein
VVLAAFVLMMCLVSGTENSIAGWTATLALARGYTYAEAANLTALFFAAILGGRLIAAALGRRARAELMAVAGIGAPRPCGRQLTPWARRLRATGPRSRRSSATPIWVGSALPTSAHTNAVVIAGALSAQRCFA